MELVVRSDVIKKWMHGNDPFTVVKDIKGLVVRCKEGRTTQRFEINGAGFYAKHHGGVGWLEIFKNLIQCRLPILGATNEWLAINHLHSLGVDTLNAAAYGVKGNNPAHQQSFLITDELTGVISLEDLSKEWLSKPPSFVLKRALITRVARMTRIMHRSGMNHRDLYICHFLLNLSALTEPVNPQSIHVYLIDLHRATIRSTVPRRWLIKDIGSLYFSILQAGFTRRDIYRFLKEYYQQPLGTIFLEQSSFLRAVERRAINLYVKDFNSQPSLPC